MLTEQKKKCIEIYNLGLELYKTRQFKEAKLKFEEALKADPTDGPSKLYVDRSDHFIHEPPPADWDGSYEMKTK